MGTQKNLPREKERKKEKEGRKKTGRRTDRETRVPGKTPGDETDGRVSSKSMEAGRDCLRTTVVVCSLPLLSSLWTMKFNYGENAFIVKYPVFVF